MRIMASDSLARALANAQRSYHAAKASVSSLGADLMGAMPQGVPVHRQDLSQAAEQLDHFTGWVYSSVRPIAQKIAGQPIHVGKKRGKVRGRKGYAELEPLESHPLLELLADPNELSVAWSLVFVTVASLELTGRQLWWLPKKEQILPIPTSWLCGFEGSTKFESFRIRPPGHAGEPIALPSDECCYFSYPSPCDPHGAVSPLQAAAAGVDADEQIVRSQVMAFENGINPHHAIIVGKSPFGDFPGGLRPRLTDAQQQQIVSGIKRRYAGTGRAGEPLILDSLIEDIKKLNHSPSEMDWMDSSKLMKDRITQIFGVNPIIMGQIENANRASATAADQHFIDHTVNPKIALMSQCLTEWLSPMFGGDIVVWIEPCVAHDAEMSVKWAELLCRYSSITGDELRTLSPLGLEAIGLNDPVKQGSPDQQLADAAGELSKATLALNRSSEIEPRWAANRIMKLIEPSGNGKH